MISWSPTSVAGKLRNNSPEAVGAFMGTTPWSVDGFAERKVMEDPAMSADQSGLMPANFTTLAHFSMSSAMNLPNSAEELANVV